MRTESLGLSPTEDHSICMAVYSLNHWPKGGGAHPWGRCKLSCKIPSLGQMQVILGKTPSSGQPPLWALPAQAQMLPSLSPFPL